MHFEKSEMEFIHYRWQQEEQKNGTLFSGEPSRRLFDPLNGDQVLFIINYCGSFIEDFNVKHARVLEKRIAYSLPSDLKSEISVLKWLQEVASPAV